MNKTSAQRARTEGSLFSNDKSRVLSPYKYTLGKITLDLQFKEWFPSARVPHGSQPGGWRRRARRKSWRKNEAERGNEKTRKKCARESLIRSSGDLSPSSCTLPGEYRLSVVRLGVLHSSKYLGIFEESRVPKKTVYSVRRRDPSRESERVRAWNSHRQRLSSTVKHARRIARMPGEKNIQREEIYGDALYTKRYRASAFRAADSFRRTHRILNRYHFLF